MEAMTAAPKQSVKSKPKNGPVRGREQLAQAHRARQAAESALKKSAAALARAEQAVQDAEGDLEKYHEVDQQIAAARAEMLKHSKTGSLPGDLIAQRKAREADKESRVETKAAFELLKTEHVAAEKALREATQAH